MMKETAAASVELNEAAKSSGELIASLDWNARIEELNRSVDGRIELMAAQSHRLMSDFFRRIYIVLGVLVALVIAYRIITILTARRISN